MLLSSAEAKSTAAGSHQPTVLGACAGASPYASCLEFFAHIFARLDRSGDGRYSDHSDTEGKLQHNRRLRRAMDGSSGPTAGNDIGAAFQMS